LASEQEIKTQLDKLIKERDAELQSHAKRRKEEHDKIEKNGKAYLKEVTEELQKQHINLEAIHKLGAKKEKAAREEVDKVREQLIKKKNSLQTSSGGLSLTQGLLFSSHRGQVPFDFVQGLLPYYTKQYHMEGANAVVDVEGYNIGNVNPWTKAWGDGSGLGAVGYFDPELVVDRWYVFRPDITRSYDFDVHMSYHGLYIVRADDGVWDSKDAWVKINGYIQARQYDNWLSRSD
jgi:hypothetical protein